MSGAGGAGAAAAGGGGGSGGGGGGWVGLQCVCANVAPVGFMLRMEAEDRRC